MFLFHACWKCGMLLGSTHCPPICHKSQRTYADCETEPIKCSPHNCWHGERHTWAKRATAETCSYVAHLATFPNCFPIVVFLVKLGRGTSTKIKRYWAPLSFQRILFTGADVNNKQLGLARFCFLCWGLEMAKSRQITKVNQIFSWDPWRDLWFQISQLDRFPRLLRKKMKSSIQICTRTAIP